MPIDRIGTAGIEDGSIVQADLASGVAGTGPAFSAYRSTAQTVTNDVYTKLLANTEEFDTNGNYDNTTNHRFQPTVPGYYQINGQIYFFSTGSITTGFTIIYKNGVRFKDGNYLQINLTSSAFLTANALIYLNGTTDYVELYGYMLGTGTLSFQVNAGTTSYFQGFLVRAA
jgi:hypothetical protein